MRKLSKRYPPLNALRGFEAAARLGSFSRAAEEQNMTQSAISHQVKSLEDFFGQPLFKRIGRTVELTDAGRDFLETATATLELLARGARRLDAYLKPGSVIVATTPAFAQKWLIPRFSRLRADHPDLQPWLYTTDERVDLEHAEIDLAIWRGRGDWPGVVAVKLIDDWVAPMCAPALLSGRASPPADLSGFSLLHDERWEDWRAWFERAGIERDGLDAGYDFSDSGLLLDSAALGHGVALGSLVLAERHLRDGTLVRPFPGAMKCEEAYYAVCLERQSGRPAVTSLWDWLIARGRAFNERLRAEMAPVDGQTGDG